MFWGKKKDPKPDVASPPPQPPREGPAGRQSGVVKAGGSGMQASQAPPANLLSMFEFPTSKQKTPPTAVGLSGICRADEPNDIQACVWSIDPLEKENDTPLFRIYF